MASIPFFGPPSVNAQYSPPFNGPPNPKQPFWDEGKGFKPADNSGQNGGAQDPNWEAPLAAWSEWDYAYLTTPDGQLLVPGLVTVTCHKSNRAQKKNTAGAHGAEWTMLGLDTADVDISCQMWTRAHFVAYEALVGSIQRQIIFALNGPAIPNDPSNPRKAIAFKCSHPALALYQIESLVFLGFTVPKRTATPQVYEAMLKFGEFQPISQAAAPVTAKRPVSELQGKAAYGGGSSPPQTPSSSGLALP